MGIVRYLNEENTKNKGSSTIKQNVEPALKDTKIDQSSFSEMLDCVECSWSLSWFVNSIE